MISNVYSYYLSQYATRPVSRHDSHKKSELRSIYNNMISINKKSPLYKIDLSDDMQKLAIDIKESAIELRSISMELSDVEDGVVEKRYTAQSSQEEVVSAKLINPGMGTEKSFNVDVKQLATNQVNTGHYLQPKSKQLEEGLYSFDVDTSGVTYELQFTVGKQDTTGSVQEKLSRLINKSGIGLSAEVLTDSLGNTALSIQSNDTGVQNLKPYIFNITDEQSDNLQGAVEYLGLDRVVQYPGNAVFTINGDQKTTAKNSYSIDSNIELELKGITDEVVEIKIAEDAQMVADEIVKFMDSYNKIVDFARNSSEKFKGGSRLLGEFERLTRAYNDVLMNNGFSVAENGEIAAKDTDAVKTADKESVSKILTGLDGFRNSVVRKADAMISNPMEYLDKKIVAYKNPARSFASPYSSSTYAGIMFDGYY